MAEFYDKVVVTVPDGLSPGLVAQARREAQDEYVDHLGNRLGVLVGLAEDGIVIHLHDPVTGESHDETIVEAKARRPGRG